MDAAGDVYAVGTANLTTTTKGKSTTQSYWTVREQIAGQSGFTTVDSVANGGTPNGVTVIGSGANAGIYVAGQAQKVSGGQEDWVVRKSGNGGSTWSTVDDFEYGSGLHSEAEAVTADPAGNLYVVGWGVKAISGSTDTYDWLVRKSADGGATWTINDDYHVSSNYAEAYAAGVDLAGNEYVVGQAEESSIWHSIVRTNTGGAWTTVDDFQLAAGKTSIGRAFTVDSSGNLYDGGDAVDGSNTAHWIIRSASGPATASSAASVSSEAAVFFSTLITSPIEQTDVVHHRKRHG